MKIACFLLVLTLETHGTASSTASYHLSLLHSFGASRPDLAGVETLSPTLGHRRQLVHSCIRRSTARLEAHWQQRSRLVRGSGSQHDQTMYTFWEAASGTLQSVSTTLSNGHLCHAP